MFGNDSKLRTTQGERGGTPTCRGCKRGRQRGVQREFSACSSLLSLLPSFPFFLRCTYFLSLSLSLSIFVSFFIHPLKTNEPHSCLCFPGVKMKQHSPDDRPYLPCKCICMCVCVCVCLQVHVNILLQCSVGGLKHSVGGRLGRNTKRTTIHQKTQTLASIS